MKKIGLLIAVLAVASCAEPAPYQKEMQTVGSTRAVKVLTTEDGTTLWAYDPPNESTVYFSTSGTSQNVGCGKGCTRSNIVSSTPTTPDQTAEAVTGRIVSQTRNPDGTVTLTIRP